MLSYISIQIFCQHKFFLNYTDFLSVKQLRIYIYLKFSCSYVMCVIMGPTFSIHPGTITSFSPTYFCYLQCYAQPGTQITDSLQYQLLLSSQPFKY